MKILLVAFAFLFCAGPIHADKLDELIKIKQSTSEKLNYQFENWPREKLTIEIDENRLVKISLSRGVIVRTEMTIDDFQRLLIWGMSATPGPWDHAVEQNVLTCPLATERKSLEPERLKKKGIKL